MRRSRPSCPRKAIHVQAAARMTTAAWAALASQPGAPSTVAQAQTLRPHSRPVCDHAGSAAPPIRPPGTAWPNQSHHGARPNTAALRVTADDADTDATAEARQLRAASKATGTINANCGL